MSATITDTFKFKILEDLLKKGRNIDVPLGDSDRFYVGIGRSQEWENDSDFPTLSIPSLKEERNFRLSLQSIKEVLDISFIVPRFNWSSGTVFSQYDDRNFSVQVLNNPYYVITDESNVFVCIKQGRNAAGNVVNSSIKPTDVSLVPVEYPDGYVWKFLYSVGSLSASRFLASNFQPVEKVVDSDINPIQEQQLTVQNSAVPGQILSIVLTDRGSGYTSPPTISIIGDGTGAKAIAQIDSASGTISNVFMKDSASGPLTFGQNYNFASVIVSGNAKLRPIFSPENGIGADPRIDLRSNGLMFNVKPNGTESGKFIVNQSFRQVGLLINPQKDSSTSSSFVGDSAFIENVGFALRHIQLDESSVSLSNAEGQIVTGNSSLANAYVDFYDQSQYRLYVHQDEVTKFLPFTEGETLSFSDGFSSASMISSGFDSDTGSLFYSDVDKFSGDLLYIDNRAAITRDVDQTEDIKIVIQI